MTIAVYTSCAVNYYAKALVLLDSIRKNSPNTTVTLVLCDIPPLDLDPHADGFDDVWTLEALGYDKCWIFQHNIMELCTGVKGRALEKLMENQPDADLYAYLDPDVYVYEDLANVLVDLGSASIGLVPHILWPEETDIGVRMTEMSVTEHGIYNLGHLFVRGDKTGRALAAWWRARLDEHCFDDREFGLFTDQRWMDLVPAIFENVQIIREPVYDVASWNLFGRDIVLLEDSHASARYFVNGKKLITYHFSGSGPTGTHAKVRQVFAPCSGAAAELERQYDEALQAQGQKWLERVPSAYEYFPDGTPVKAEARKIYRRHKDLQHAFPDPYQDGYLAWLKENRPTLARGLVVSDRRAEQAFDEMFDSAWYVEKYPDVAEALERGIWESARQHYISLGSALLYDPGPFFISSYYYELAKYLDGYKLRNKHKNEKSTLLWHYIKVGLANGIEPIEIFDSNWYLDEHEDLFKAYRTGRFSIPLVHFIKHGDREWRKPGPSFDPVSFVKVDGRAQDLIDRGVVDGPFAAYVQLGLVDGRASI